MPSTASLKLSIQYQVDGEDVLFDNIQYKNFAKNSYSIVSLEYYISKICFNNANGLSFKSKSVYYINAKNKSTNYLLLDSIPPGTYTSISFYIGLDSLTNKTGALLNSIENINMAWPDYMGGGYHFMKMEGYFLDTSNVIQDGYAIHLGKNAHLIQVSINKQFDLRLKNQTENLIMNINEWFKNPHIYDFNSDGNYSMNNDNAMLKLSQNGKDVFTIEQ